MCSAQLLRRRAGAICEAARRLEEDEDEPSRRFARRHRLLTTLDRVGTMDRKEDFIRFWYDSFISH